MSLSELAAELRVHPSTLWRWETGKTAPRASTALRWASVLSRLAAETAAFPRMRAAAEPASREAAP